MTSNNRLQTVRDKVLSVITGQCPGAEPGRYASNPFREGLL
jgi:hypothetical protein